MNTQEFLMKKIKEKEGNYFKVINLLIENDINKDSVMSIYDKYKKHKNLLNNNNIYFFDYFNKEGDLNKQFEDLSDDIHKSIVKSNYKKIKKVLYSKHNDILNEKTERIIQMFAEAEISPSLIKKTIGKKIRGFSDVDYLNSELEKLYEEVQGDWNKKNYLEKLKKTN